MTLAAWLYGALTTAAVAAGLVIPLAVHRSAGSGLPAWEAAVLPGALSKAHAPLTSQCAACHTPHVGVEARNCIACHANRPAVTGKQSTAFHAVIGECAGCHVEHEGSARPVAMDHALLATVGRRRASEEPIGVVRALRDYVVTLGGDAAPVAAVLDCATCHSNRDPHRDLFGRQCSACHGLLSWKISGFRHPTPASKDCAQCHRAPPSHYMGHFTMVSRRIAKQEHAAVEECHLCHTTDSWNSIRGIGWYKHH